MAGIKGRSGRRRKPIALHLCDGTFRKDRHGARRAPTASPESPAVDVVPPSWLRPAERRIWNQLAPEMLRLNLLTPLDVPIFVSLCVTYAELQWSCRQRSRWTKTTFGQPKLASVVTYRMQLIEKLASLCERFGATPSSRGRVADLLPPPDPVPPAPPTRGGPILTRLGTPT